MKILAVIPARAGSKGIPNKNIRIIAGYPLIYYSIKNAKASQYITDIVVTTDSTEIQIIAAQMGVQCRERDQRLCGDAVTLDAVVADAIPRSVNWDYIITMQPTSPTLTVETLDRAIGYTIENNLDTVLSVCNAPHLSWKEEGGKKVPNYTERLNRQYLPPCYMETGAFVISKADVVTEYTRIGKQVDVFEVPEKEALDVDTFSDLMSVSAILSQKKVAIYTNGNNIRGLGHIYRALELADEFYTKPDILFDEEQTDIHVFGRTTHNLCPVCGENQLFERCGEEKYDIFINDILDTTSEYMHHLRKAMPHARIVNFEDDGEGAKNADLVINALYEWTNNRNTYVGEDYYIAGKTFMFYEPITIAERVRSVLITFGGADPQNYTETILDIIQRSEYAGYSFTVVLGKTKKNVETLMELNRIGNITVLYDVKNMAEIMSKCDLAITSRGRTTYETAMLGIPAIVMAQNEREERHEFASNENGFTYIGMNPPKSVIKANLDMYLAMSQSDRMQFQKKLLSHKLRKGRKRVMSLINSL